MKNPNLALFMEFFQSQGAEFVDSETGEKLVVENGEVKRKGK